MVLALFHTGLLALESTHMREWGDATELRMVDTDDEKSGRERDGLRYTEARRKVPLLVLRATQAEEFDM